jgi:hypothetical protein
MATRADFTFAREGDVVISYKTGSAGTVPTSGFLALGCPKGTWTLGSSTASIDDGLDNWCTAVEAAIEGASPGAKTITLSGSMELILGDTAYGELVGAEAANTYGWFKIAVADNAGVESSDIYVGGYITQWDLNFNGTGPSDVTVTFRASERQIDPVLT